MHVLPPGGGTPATVVMVTASSSGLLTRDQVATCTLSASVGGGVVPYTFGWTTSSVNTTINAPSSNNTTVDMVESSQNQTFHFMLTVTDIHGSMDTSTVDVAVSFPNPPV